VVAAWRRAWTQVIPFFAFPPEIRRLIYTTNALESVHAQLRKIITTRGHFPNDDARRNCSGWRCATSPRSGSGPPMRGTPQ
jgi:transposase-like protein